VFFYRSPHNGRVFFDDVGWPWPKHPCTDKYAGSDSGISRASNSRIKFNLRGHDGKLFEIFILEHIISHKDELLLSLKKGEHWDRIQIAISNRELLDKAVSKADIEEAPSLVLPKGWRSDMEVNVTFICARLQSIVMLSGLERQTNSSKQPLPHRK
jgi:hypothetical protein